MNPGMGALSLASTFEVRSLRSQYDGQCSERCLAIQRSSRDTRTSQQMSDRAHAHAILPEVVLVRSPFRHQRESVNSQPDHRLQGASPRQLA